MGYRSVEFPKTPTWQTDPAFWCRIALTEMDRRLAETGVTVSRMKKPPDPHNFEAQQWWSVAQPISDDWGRATAKAKARELGALLAEKIVELALVSRWIRVGVPYRRPDDHLGFRASIMLSKKTGLVLRVTTHFQADTGVVATADVFWEET